MHELTPKELAATVRPLYATEDEVAPIARVKLFSCFSGWTRLVAECDPESDEVFGLVKGSEGEWGHISICEMEKVNHSKGLNVIERDFYFDPKPVSEVG